MDDRNHESSRLQLIMTNKVLVNKNSAKTSLYLTHNYFQQSNMYNDFCSCFL